MANILQGFIVAACVAATEPCFGQKSAADMFPLHATKAASEAWVTAEHKRLAPYLGKVFWVKPRTFGGQAEFIQTDLKGPKHNGRALIFSVSKPERFRVAAIDNGLCEKERIPCQLIVVFDDGTEARISEGAIRLDLYDPKSVGVNSRLDSALFTTEDPVKMAARQAKKEGVRIGMSKDQVLASIWGKPRSVRKTHTSSGTDEQWVYDGGYLYFRNGILEMVQN